MAIVERIISLLKGRVEARRFYFDRLIEPLFQDLCLIHNDYMSSFQSVRDALQAAEHHHEQGMRVSQAAIKKAIDTARRNRARYEGLRTKAQRLINEMPEGKNRHQEQEFLRAVKKYFPSDRRTKVVPELPLALTSNHPNFISTVLTDFKTVEQMLSSVEIAVFEAILLNVSPNARYKEADRAIRKLGDNRSSRWANVCDAYAKLKIASVK